ncbi:hypothetical protein [Nostoc sp. FACHB-280]|uniref:hypothetical protein n=1 Tax=Nostoc sp. FACHB-280 TaxID=2692839 RepID=UPI00168C01AB|nr:hypothetical protein [Nostoc sp. FACHB-280]MBD2495533.1 hypothetical protein [Nostoc sp. FACHB-280]
MKRLLFVGTFLPVFLFYQPKTFGQISFPNNILNLAPIQLDEIFNAGSNQVGDATLETTFITPALPTPAIKTVVVNRTETDLWRLELSNPQDLTVKYELLSGNGNLNRLSSKISSDEIKVDIDPIEPKEISSDPQKGTKTVQGGATFTLDLSKIRTSGSYSGTLKVTFTGI